MDSGPWKHTQVTSIQVCCSYCAWSLNLPKSISSFTHQWIFTSAFEQESYHFINLRGGFWGSIMSLACEAGIRCANITSCTSVHAWRYLGGADHLQICRTVPSCTVMPEVRPCQAQCQHCWPISPRRTSRGKPVHSRRRAVKVEMQAFWGRRRRMTVYCKLSQLDGKGTRRRRIVGLMAHFHPNFLCHFPHLHPWEYCWSRDLNQTRRRNMQMFRRKARQHWGQHHWNCWECVYDSHMEALF